MYLVSHAHRNCHCRNLIFFYSKTTCTGPGQPPHRSFTITSRQTTLDRTPVHEGSAQSQRPLPDNTQHSQETDIHAPAGFEPAIPASERPQTEALASAANGICRNLITVHYISIYCEKYSNKNKLRSAGKVFKSSELVGDISEVLPPPPLHFLKKMGGRGS